MRLYTGCVENRQDPLKLGRCQVRVVGLHNHDKGQLKTEDLPWAYPMQPVTSAAMSGIGQSPIGPVEGTWVVILFRDEDEQQPIIMGTLGGIPQDFGSVDQDQDGMILKKDGYIAGAESQTVTNPDGDTASNDSTPLVEEDTGLHPASYYNPSNDCLNLIKNYEGLRLTAYQDSAGIWTVGYGTTKINGIPVVQGQTITQQDAEKYLLLHITETSAPTVKQSVKTLITQSMFDSMCSFVYNAGSGAFNKSSAIKELNTGKYVEAANYFTEYNKATINGVKTVIPGLTKRRQAEQTLFLKDGVPTVGGDLRPMVSDRIPVDTVAQATSAASNGLKDNGIAMVLGFRDPKGKYPLYLNEPDTNKLARHEDIKKTIVRRKEISRDKGVVTAQDKTWDQSQIPYNAKYPFNHVFMSESGHIMEFDDTENSERIHLYHKSGTFTEIDANGTQVNKIIGDGYEILERNGYVWIKGTANVTIDGDHNVKINNALNVDVSGKTTINVFNDVAMNVSGNMDMSVKEAFKLRAASINLETYSGAVNVKSANSINVESAAAQSYLAGATFNVDAIRVDIANGTAGSANGTELETPSDKLEPTLPEFTDLVVITRGVEAAAHYETPDEGDPSEYIDKRIADGTLDPDEKDTGTETGSATTTANNVATLPQSCNMINGMEKFTADLQLSPHFNLGALCSNGTRMPVNQQGLTAQQIVCNLKGLAENCLEKIIDLYPAAVITSGFRRPGDVAKSSATSQHYLGEAADIVIPGYNRQKHYEAIQAIQSVIPYDQLILEYSGSNTVWIHVSFKYNGARKQNFTMRDHKRVSEFGTFTLIT